MVEYGCNVANKFGFMSDDDDFEDPRELIARAAEVEANKAAALKKAPPKAAAPAPKTEAPKPAAGKENRPVERAERGRGGRGRGGERRGGPREGGNRPPREGGDLADRFGESGGRGRGGARGERRGGPRPFRGRGNFNQTGDRTSGDEAPKVEGAGFEDAPMTDDAGFRGRGRGRGGFRGRVGFAGRGRQYDRQSGSDRTGVRSTEKKEGHGKGNWGDVKDEIAAEIDAPAAEAENQEPPAPREKTAEEIQYEKDMEEFKKMKTLKEYKAEKQAEAAAFKTRKAGEGVNDNFGKLIPLQKEQAGNKDEDVIVMRKESNKKVLNIDIHFLEANRRQGGGDNRGERTDRGGAPRGARGGGRGGQRGGGGRGGQGPSGNYGGRQGGHFDASSAEEFPALK